MSSTTRTNALLLTMVLVLFLNPGLSNAHDSRLNFEFTKGPGILDLESGSNDERMMAASFASGFETAANLWRAVLDDPVTVNFTLDMDNGSLPEGTGGGAIPVLEVYDYAQTVHPALVADRSSVDDATTMAFAIAVGDRN